MEKLTFDEIKATLNEDEGQHFLEYNFPPTEYSTYFPTIGEIEYKTGGGFDVDEYYSEVPIYRVYYFKDHDIYIKFIGRYASYGGCEYDNLIQVFPSTKVVTVYEPLETTQ